MKINLDQTFVGLPENTPLTLGDVAFACVNYVPQGKQIPPDQSRQRGALAMRLHTKGEVDLKAEDLALIQQCLPGPFAPFVHAQAHDMLEV